MTPSKAYSDLVANFARRFEAAKTERDRTDARADFDAECILLRTLGPRERKHEHAQDADAERLLAARFGPRAA
ncbi:MAG: hypothetical protein KJZ75_13970 [Hyphomonadaceae bacterium]|nr:hypothetical protein [Hyphomonadaceae bacterium]